MINVPFIRVMTYSVASGELPTEDSAVILTVLGEAKLSYLGSILEPHPLFWCLAKQSKLQCVLLIPEQMRFYGVK